MSSYFEIEADRAEIGGAMHRLISELYPICRSITGEGFRRTLEILRRRIPMELREVPSGTGVFDWTVPDEWNIRDAYIKSPRGDKIVDFARSNLHVVSYSIPVNEKLALSELKRHLFTIPERPEWIPYRTSYYTRNWGFCLSHHDLEKLEEGDYEVVIDASLEKGSLTYGELLLKGEQVDEVLISCHACHPSLANDNLSGVSLATLLAEKVAAARRRYSYRFLFIPGTIGAITWLSLNQAVLPRIRYGLVLSGVGDPGAVTYKKSRRGVAEIDRASIHVLGSCADPCQVEEFTPYGYDERQYCSPGIDLPVGRFSRTPFGKYPQYHTSADDLSFIQAESLGDSFCKVVAILQLLERNRTYLSLNPNCEPQLGKRGLYPSMGAREFALLWVMNLSDGSNSLLDIAERSGIAFSLIDESATILAENGLLKALF